MKIHLERGAGLNIIRAYDVGTVRIKDDEYRHSLIVTPATVIADWAPQGFDQLQPEHFRQIAVLMPEVVLLGTGVRLRFPHPGMTRALIDANIGMEVMDTGAACRTYNILLAEGRNVAAALLLDDRG